MKLPIGQYRLTASSMKAGGESSFVEVDLTLMDSGQQDTTRVVFAETVGGVEQGVIARLLPINIAGSEQRMALIPAGPVDVGIPETNRPLWRARTVSIPAFYMDRMEVSNKEYLQFLQETAAREEVRARLQGWASGQQVVPAGSGSHSDDHPRTPQYWKTLGYDANLADRPVVGIRMQDAAAYAAWAGKRLPTMFEYQAAAKGGGAAGAGPLIPSALEQGDGLLQQVEQTARVSGDAMETFRLARQASDFLRQKLQILVLDQARDLKTRRDLYAMASVPVDSPDPWVTTSGILHLYDNAREMTSSIDFDNVDGSEMGRCWVDDPVYSPVGAAWSYPLNEPYFNRGFRCAKSAAPVGSP